MPKTMTIARIKAEEYSKYSVLPIDLLELACSYLGFQKFYCPITQKSLTQEKAAWLSPAKRHSDSQRSIQESKIDTRLYHRDAFKMAYEAKEFELFFTSYAVSHEPNLASSVTDEDHAFLRALENFAQDYIEHRTYDEKKSHCDCRNADCSYDHTPSTIVNTLLQTLTVTINARTRNHSCINIALELMSALTENRNNSSPSHIVRNILESREPIRVTSISRFNANEKMKRFFEFLFMDILPTISPILKTNSNLYSFIYSTTSMGYLHHRYKLYKEISPIQAHGLYFTLSNILICLDRIGKATFFVSTLFPKKIALRLNGLEVPLALVVSIMLPNPSILIGQAGLNKYLLKLITQKKGISLSHKEKKMLKNPKFLFFFISGLLDTALTTLLPYVVPSSLSSSYIFSSKVIGSVMTATAVGCDIPKQYLASMQTVKNFSDEKVSDNPHSLFPSNSPWKKTFSCWNILAILFGGFAVLQATDNPLFAILIILKMLTIFNGLSLPEAIRNERNGYVLSTQPEREHHNTRNVPESKYDSSI